MAQRTTFSPDYLSARERFRQAAAALGCRQEAHPIDSRGPQNHELTIDAAFFGDPRPQRLLIVSSGLHGVEGSFGAAVQVAWLESRRPAGDPPPGSAVIMLHALNPYGFAWRRRWNESNVDLNRNFLGDRSFLTDDLSYEETRELSETLHPFLNPASPPSRFEPFRLEALAVILLQGLAARRKFSARERPSLLAVRKLATAGLAQLQKTLPVGQYEHPEGLFYGGAKVEQSTMILQAQLPVWVGDAREILHLDFHTGLGAWAEHKLLSVDEANSERGRWAAARFGADLVEAPDGPTAYRARGAMGTFFRDYFKDRAYHCLTAEFGTYPAVRVLGALRAENRAHFYARRGAASYTWAKQQLVEVFCPASDGWRAAVVEKGVKLIDRGVEVCFANCAG